MRVVSKTSFITYNHSSLIIEFGGETDRMIFPLQSSGTLWFSVTEATLQDWWSCRPYSLFNQLCSPAYRSICGWFQTMDGERRWGSWERVLNCFSRLLSNMGTSFFQPDDWIRTCSTYKSCAIALDVWLLGEWIALRKVKQVWLTR